MLLHPNTLLGLPFSRYTHTSRYLLSSFNITIWPFEGALWTQGIQIYIFFIVKKEKDAYIFLKKKVFSRHSEYQLEWYFIQSKVSSWYRIEYLYFQLVKVKIICQGHKPNDADQDLQSTGSPQMFGDTNQSVRGKLVISSW